MCGIILHGKNHWENMRKASEKLEKAYARPEESVSYVKVTSQYVWNRNVSFF